MFSFWIMISLCEEYLLFKKFWNIEFWKKYKKSCEAVIKNFSKKIYVQSYAYKLDFKLHIGLRDFYPVINPNINKH